MTAIYKPLDKEANMTTNGRLTFRLPRGGSPDVFITTPSHQFNLHSQMLKLCSGWFSASMSKAWWTGTEKVDGTEHYRYVLDLDKDGISTLLPEHQPGALTSSEGTSSSEELGTVCEALLNMFKCFYRQPIKIRTYDGYSALISIADQYDALDSVSESIRASFFEWSDLDIQIKESPTRFLLLGYKLRSAPVFKEAFIHIVGLFVGEHDALAAWIREGVIPEPLMRLVSAECCRLNQLVAKTMQSFLMVGIGCEDTQVSTRMAAVIAKSRLGGIIAAHKTPGYDGAMFRAIVGDPFSMGSGEIGDIVGARLAAHFSSVAASSEGLVREIKEAAAVLARSNLRFKEEMRYLTCAELLEEDLPW